MTEDTLRLNEKVIEQRAKIISQAEQIKRMYLTISEDSRTIRKLNDKQRALDEFLEKVAE